MKILKIVKIYSLPLDIVLLTLVLLKLLPELKDLTNQNNEMSLVDYNCMLKHVFIGEISLKWITKFLYVHTFCLVVHFNESVAQENSILTVVDTKSHRLIKNYSFSVMQFYQ